MYDRSKDGISFTNFYQRAMLFNYVHIKYNCNVRLYKNLYSRLGRDSLNSLRFYDSCWTDLTENHGNKLDYVHPVSFTLWLHGAQRTRGKLWLFILLPLPAGPLFASLLSVATAPSPCPVSPRGGTSFLLLLIGGASRSIRRVEAPQISAEQGRCAAVFKWHQRLWLLGRGGGWGAFSI